MEEEQGEGVCEEQPPHSALSFITPVLGDRTGPSGLCGHAYHAQTWKQNTHTHTI